MLIRFIVSLLLLSIHQQNQSNYQMAREIQTKRWTSNKSYNCPVYAARRVIGPFGGISRARFMNNQWFHWWTLSPASSSPRSSIIFVCETVHSLGHSFRVARCCCAAAAPKNREPGQFPVSNFNSLSPSVRRFFLCTISSDSVQQAVFKFAS